MKWMHWIASLLFFSLLSPSCAGQRYGDPLAAMKQELVIAQSTLYAQQQYIASLEEKIALQEIMQIQQEISRIRRKEARHHQLSYEEGLALFFHQREVLAEIISKHPTCQTQAQAVLDQILTLITQLSEAKSQENSSVR